MGSDVADRYTVVYEGDPSGIRILNGEPASGEAVGVQLGDAFHEIDRLRKALIETGIAIGCILGPGVSTDFLMNVPNEARLVMKKLRTVAPPSQAGEGEGATDG